MPDSPSSQNEKSTIGLLVAAAIVGVALITLLFTIFYTGNQADLNEADPNADGSDSTAQSDELNGPTFMAPLGNTEIAVARIDSELNYIGQINSDDPKGQDVHQGEYGRIEVVLPERRYMLVVGIAANQGNVRNVECLWPKDGKRRPIYCDGLIYGRNHDKDCQLVYRIDHDIASRVNPWKLSQGSGLYAVLVISSRDVQLPSFAEIQSQLHEIPWPSEDVTPGNWSIRDNKALGQIVATGENEMQRSSASTELQPVVDNLLDLFEDAHIDGVVFYVK